MLNPSTAQPKLLSFVEFLNVVEDRNFKKQKLTKLERKEVDLLIVQCLKFNTSLWNYEAMGLYPKHEKVQHTWKRVAYHIYRLTGHLLNLITTRQYWIHLKNTYCKRRYQHLRTGKAPHFEYYEKMSYLQDYADGKNSKKYAEKAVQMKDEDEGQEGGEGEEEGEENDSGQSTSSQKKFEIDQKELEKHNNYLLNQLVQLGGCGERSEIPAKNNGEGGLADFENAAMVQSFLSCYPAFAELISQPFDMSSESASSSTHPFPSPLAPSPAFQWNPNVFLPLCPNLTPADTSSSRASIETFPGGGDSASASESSSSSPSSSILPFYSSSPLSETKPAWKVEADYVYEELLNVLSKMESDPKKLENAMLEAMRLFWTPSEMKF